MALCIHYSRMITRRVEVVRSDGEDSAQRVDRSVHGMSNRPSQRQHVDPDSIIVKMHASRPMEK